MRVSVIGRWGGCSRRGEACAGYLVQSGDTNVLIDCGSGVTGRVQQLAPLESIDTVIISHWHADHCGDAGVLMHGRVIQMQVGQTQRPIDFYGLPQEPDLSRLENPPYSHAHAVVEDSQLTVGPLRFTFMGTSHVVRCLAVKVEDGRSTFVYTSDGALTDELVAFCSGADVLVAECSLYHSTYKGFDARTLGHMSAEDVAVLGERACPRKLILSHLPFYGEVEDLLASVRRQWDGDVELAGDMSGYDL